ncbi:Galactoside 2-alpha-L-fucosyltransferase 2 [Lamellibrachia satsuma]|nr:Galactoside 2-alpha-L-fucosyltransferase 2 [Lamellibrachia satsuma]
MLLDGSSAKKWSCWRRVRAASVNVLLLIGVALVYMAYSGRWLHGAPPIMRVADNGQRRSNKTVTTHAAINYSRGDRATAGHRTPDQSMVTASSLLVSKAQRETATLNNAWTKHSPLTTKLLPSLLAPTTTPTRVSSAPKSTMTRSALEVINATTANISTTPRVQTVTTTTRKTVTISPDKTTTTTSSKTMTTTSGKTTTTTRDKTTTTTSGKAPTTTSGKTATTSSSTTSVTPATVYRTTTNFYLSNKRYKVYQPGMGGRIGNQMFEYAAAYGIARMNNRSAVTHVTNFDMIRNLFTNLSLPRSPNLSNMTTVSEGKYGTYSTKYEKLPESNVKLWGYFQCWKYFQRYNNDLRREFTFNESIRTKSMDYLKNITRMHNSRNITFVGVHVRRGDRVHSQLYRVASKLYITHAMDDFRRNFTKVHFVVCSDDISWCKENLGQQKNVSFSVGRSPVDDFVVLSMCNHTISTVGTFSWWVGWLAGGTTTYYVNHANVSTYMYKDLTFADYFLPNWIPMSD